jgi:ribonuclease E
VIDFIDMEDRRNNRKVENRLRDALSSRTAPEFRLGVFHLLVLLELSSSTIKPAMVQFQQCFALLEGVGTVKRLILPYPATCH